MSVLFQNVINTGKFYSLNKSLRASLSKCKCLSVRKYSENPKKFASFDDVVAQRRAEAKRSIVVQVNSESSFNELYCYCSKYAEVHGIHHYRNTEGEHFMLVEFKSEDCLKDVLRTCSSHQKNEDVMASNSPFLWFRAVSGKREKLSAAQTQSLVIKDGNATVDEEVLYRELAECSSVSDQIQLLYNRTKLNDLGVRLRYMVARHLEVIFDSLYANVKVQPFGSSVNGFGKMGCDLDLVLTDDVTDEMSDPRRRLVFQQKRCGETRDAWRRQLELAAALLEARACGAARLQRVLHARVPILKFAHQLADLECDLCVNNTSGVDMSAALWALGGAGVVGGVGVVGSLVCAARRWARGAGLTSAVPGRWITNFPLTLLVLHYLQQRALLPPLHRLRTHDDKRNTPKDSVDGASFRRTNELPAEYGGLESANLEVLLLQFFEYYAQFDFQEKAISINDGAAVRKPNSQPLYIINPLDPTQNVSRNVSYEECQRLQVEIRNAAWQLEAELEGAKSDDWGLLGLIDKKSARNLKKLVRMGNSHRLVSVKDLFQEPDVTKSDYSIKSKLQRLTEKSDRDVESSVREMNEQMRREPEKTKETSRFKNRQVANEVLRIQRNKIL